MGLDMYLYARKNDYASSYTKSNVITNNYPEALTNIFEEFKPENIEKLMEADQYFYDRRCVSCQTSYEIGYWRKANAIHNFFVEHCAEGIDECQEIKVSKEALMTLLEKCKAVLENHSKAQNLLPTEDGFFFGSTEYDEYYYEDLIYTKEIVEKTLKFLEDRVANKDYDWEIIYQASW